MEEKKKDLSQYDFDQIPSAEEMSFGIVVSEWNSQITESLKDGAYETLIKHGASKENIRIYYVPGSFELPLAGEWLARQNKVDAVILLGCIIQGDTRHFDFVCQGVTQGTMNLNTKHGIPFIFGVLTTANIKQAQDRAGGKLGNKGVEAAITAIKMADLKNQILPPINF